MAKIGFIGLGQMGSAMCPNLIDSGHSLQVFDISKSAADSIGSLGAKVARTPKEAAHDCEVIFTILPVGSIVEDVVFGPDGISEGMADSAIFVEMSTILPDETRSIGKRLAERGLSMVDAPVGRTSAHAVNRKSTFMVGGTKDDFNRVLGAFRVMEFDDGDIICQYNDIADNFYVILHGHVQVFCKYKSKSIWIGVSGIDSLN